MMQEKMPLQTLCPINQAHLTEIRGFVTPLLHFLPRSIPDYTDHGVAHSENLTRLLENFRENCQDDAFSEEELFLLFATIWLHDVGCLITPQKEKYKHARMSALLLEGKSFNFIRSIIDKDFLTCISYMIISHQHDFEFDSIPRAPIHHRVRLPLLCAIFRLLDACDISASRVNPNLFDILTENDLLEEDNRNYWEAHSKIVSVVFNGEYIDVLVEDEEVASILTDHLEKDLESINKVFEEYSDWEPFLLRINERSFDWRDDLF